MTTERYWIDHCIGIARDAGNLDAAQDATKELEALRSALTDAQEIARRGDDIILGLEKTLDAARSSLTAREKLLEEVLPVLDTAGDALGKFNGWEAEKCWPMAAKIRAAMEKANG